MRRRDDFLLILQTIVLYLRPRLEVGLEIMYVAMSLPEEAIPTNLREGAQELWEHYVNRKPIPGWLAEYREQKLAQEKASKDLVTIRLNPEADAQQWWMLAEGCSDTMPKACIPIVCGRGVEAIEVPRADAEHFRDWGRGIPGWDANGIPFLFLNKDGSPALPE